MSMLMNQRINAFNEEIYTSYSVLNKRKNKSADEIKYLAVLKKYINECQFYPNGNGIVNLSDDEFKLLQDKFEAEKFKSVYDHFEALRKKRQETKDKMDSDIKDEVKAAAESLELAIQKKKAELAAAYPDENTANKDVVYTTLKSLYDNAENVLKEAKALSDDKASTNTQRRMAISVLTSTQAGIEYPNSSKNLNNYAELVKATHGKSTNGSSMVRFSGAMNIFLGSLFIAFAVVGTVASLLTFPVLALIMPIPAVLGAMMLSQGIRELQFAKRVERQHACPKVAGPCGLFHKAWKDASHTRIAPAPKAGI